MVSRKENDLNKVKRKLALYNMFPNLIWSILNLTPISIYCFRFLDNKTFYIFLSNITIKLILKIKNNTNQIKITFY